MCVMALFHRVFSNIPVLLAHWRDEEEDRPYEGPTNLISSKGRLSFGWKDNIAGGSWMAGSREGAVAGIVNLPLRKKGPLGPVSRGTVLVEYLCDGPSTHVKRLSMHSNPHIIVRAGLAGSRFLSNYGDRVSEEILPSGIFIFDRNGVNDFRETRSKNLLTRMQLIVKELGSSATPDDGLEYFADISPEYCADKHHRRQTQCSTAMALTHSPTQMLKLRGCDFGNNGPIFAFDQEVRCSNGNS